MSTPQSPTPNAPPPMGAASRVFGVFYAPGETFAGVARAPGFWLPMVILMISTFAVSVLLVNRVGMENIVRQQIQSNPRTADMPKERLEEAVERGVKFGQVFTYASPVFVPLGMLVISGVLILIVNFVFGGASTFKQMLGVVSHAALAPALISQILAIVIIMLKDPSDVDVRNLVAANLGLVISAETSKFLHRLATSIDLFSFWQIVLLAIGIVAVTKFKLSKALTAVLLPWFLYVLIASAWAAAF